jgi:O-antigen ligase
VTATLIILVLAIFNFSEKFYLIRNGYAPVVDLVDNHPSYISLFTIVSFFSTIILIRNKKYIVNKKTTYLLATFIAFSILYFRARTQVLIFVIIGLVFTVLNFRAVKRHFFLLTVISLTTFFFFLLTKPKETKYFFSRFANIEIIEATYDKRAKSWKSALKLFYESPIIGYGLGSNKELLINEYKKIEFTEGVNNKLNEHNAYLSILVTGGLVMLILFLWVFVKITVKAIKLNDWLYLTSITIFLLSMFTESLMNRQKGIEYLCLMVCLFEVFNFNKKIKKYQKNTAY